MLAVVQLRVMLTNIVAVLVVAVLVYGRFGCHPMAKSLVRCLQHGVWSDGQTEPSKF